MTHGHEKSDSAIVAVKPTNKVERSAAEQSAAEPTATEPVERRAEPPASPSRSNSAEKKESTVRRLSQLCPPCATPSSNSSLDYRRTDARIVKNGFAPSSGVSKSAKVVLALLWKILSGTRFPTQFFW